MRRFSEISPNSKVAVCPRSATWLILVVRLRHDLVMSPNICASIPAVTAVGFELKLVWLETSSRTSSNVASEHRMDYYSDQSSRVSEDVNVECGLCLQLLQEARLLPCGHSLCGHPEGCWEKLFSGSDPPKCFICETPINISSHQTPTQLPSMSATEVRFSPILKFET